jgi:hypothetical protein
MDPDESATVAHSIKFIFHFFVSFVFFVFCPTL